MIIILFSYTLVIITLLKTASTDRPCGHFASLSVMDVLATVKLCYYLFRLQCSSPVVT